MRLGTHFVTGARFPCTCYSYWGYLRAHFVSQMETMLLSIPALRRGDGDIHFKSVVMALENNPSCNYMVVLNVSFRAPITESVI